MLTLIVEVQIDGDVRWSLNTWDLKIAKDFVDAWSLVWKPMLFFQPFSLRDCTLSDGDTPSCINFPDVDAGWYVFNCTRIKTRRGKFVNHQAAYTSMPVRYQVGDQLAHHR